MPTTNKEARRILDICKRHRISPWQLYNLTNDLHEEVGRTSENDSVKQTMAMLYSIAREDLGTVNPTEALWRYAWLALIIAHAALWFVLALAAIMTMIWEPWYVAMPLVTFCVVQACSRERCPVTTLENYLRRQLNWPEIDYFGQHYAMALLRRWGLFK